MNEYKSIAEVGEEEATKVRVTGDISPFTDKQSGEKKVAYKSNFFNRLKANEDYEPQQSSQLRYSFLVLILSLMLMVLRQEES